MYNLKSTIAALVIGTVLYFPSSLSAQLSGGFSPGPLPVAEKYVLHPSAPGNSDTQLYGDLAYMAVSETDASSMRVHSSAGFGFEQTSSSVSGTSAGCQNMSTPRLSTTSLPHFRVKIDVGSVTNVRWFIGLTDDTNLTGAVASDDPTAYQLAFSFSDSSRGDVNWQISADNNGTQVVTDTGYVAAVGIYIFEINLTSSSSADFSITNNAGARVFGPTTISANVPVGAGAMLTMTWGFETQEAIAKTVTTYWSEMRVP